MSQPQPQLRVVTRPTTLLEILESVISQAPQHRTTLLLCCSKHDFLARLSLQIEDWQTSENNAPVPGEDNEGDDEPGQQPNAQPRVPNNIKPKRHPLLIPTLHLLSTSQLITLVFCPSINSLRAWIATHHPSASTSYLTIIDLLSLHQDTSEFTLQGLSRTFAGIASLAHRTNMDVSMVECVADLWDEEVPLLSGSVKIGDPRGGAGWVGRKVVVRKVVERWFSFEQ